jgi:uncharacterized ParB-like nuclease family protein
VSEQLLEIAAVRIDGETQPRTAINPGIVQEYAEAMQAGTEFPAVTVVHDGATYWLVDGFHRLHAHRRLNRQQIKAEVVAGELKDVQWMSVAANKAHGLRRYPADIAKAIARALKLRADLSDRAIAEHVGVAHTTVARHRQTIEQAQRVTGGACTTSTNHLGRDGKRYPARSPKRRGRQRTGGIARDAHKPLRAGNPLPPMIALNMPHDPLMGARALIGQFSTDYLRALVVFLNKHLEGVPA